jgi:amino acid adenylation domain-containing protein
MATDSNQKADSLSASKLELLERLLMSRTGAKAPREKISSRSEGENWPLSFAQQRLWFLDQLEPLSPLYNISWAARLEGPLQVNALRQALSAIVARHESLRTTFTQLNGIPVQVVAESCAVKWTEIDLETVDSENTEAEVRGLLQLEAERPFDLGRDLMLRATLFRLSQQEHILALGMHHIASDGWSMGILFRELGQLYEAFSQGKEASLPELPIQYADYALWQRQRLSGELLERELKYWKQKLGGELPLLELPSDRPRTAAMGYCGGRVHFDLGGELSRQLKELSRRQGVTLFMTLLAAFKILLYRYTGQTDLAVGTPIAGRTMQELEGLIGFFVNTLVLRTDLGGEPSFAELLSRVREVALGAYSHQELPFEKLVEELQPQRNLTRNPLFQVMFVLQNTPGGQLELEGLEIRNLDLDTGTAKFDLTLALTEQEEQLTGEVVFNAHLFDRETIERLAGHYRQVLEGGVADLKQPVWKLPLLSEAERRQIVAKWNRTQQNYPDCSNVVELFERQVEVSPEAEAVIFDGGGWSYRQLNERANQIAHYLRSLGVEGETLVGVCLERSPEMVAVLLGILKAGAAYVPLDPSTPADRLNWMLEDAAVKVLLTRQSLLGGMSVNQPQVVCLDRNGAEIRCCRQDNLALSIQSRQLAYVIYTSGSTGRPKGVMIEHHSLVNYLCWVNESLLTHCFVGLPALSRLTFDASLKQLLAPLIRGMQVWLVLDETATSPEALAQQLSRGRRVALNCVPSLWNAILQILRPAEKQALGHCLADLLLGGEAPPVHLIEQTLRDFPELVIWNLYGPTEATANATSFRICSSSEILIGRPIANAQTYILDARQQPVPVGVIGELYIGGEGVARGYLNRPELTAEKFTPDPFSIKPGACLYRTGDMARYKSKGDIEFLGRLDHQVKIRGYRIELREIEATLGSHPAVQASVVTAEGEGEKRRLLAYVVPDKRPGPSSVELRNHLKAKLPEYMIPSMFVEMNALPLMPNGKVDRLALPIPEQNRPDAESSFLAPRTPVEELLAEIWSEILNVERIGIRDNFFDLGGHSMLATQLISRVRSNLQVEVPLRVLFEAPTVEGLAVAVIAALAEKLELGDLSQCSLNS